MITPTLAQYTTHFHLPRVARTRLAVSSAPLFAFLFVFLRLTLLSSRTSTGLSIPCLLRLAVHCHEHSLRRTLLVLLSFVLKLVELVS